MDSTNLIGTLSTLTELLCVFALVSAWWFLPIPSLSLYDVSTTLPTVVWTDLL